MPTLINNPITQEALIAERRERGIDKFDEVWDGVYVMAPIANNEHQNIALRLAAILLSLTDSENLGQVLPGANVSDQQTDWRSNFRVPDVLVFLKDNPAEDRDTHWLGGPDFAVEIVSRWDRSREKIDFYSSVGVRELLIVDRDPWQLELFRLSDGHLQSVAIANQANALTIESQVVPISLKLTPGDKRPTIAVASRDGQSWNV